MLASSRPSGSGRRNISITCSTVSGLASASPANEKADVADDAVADFAESGEMNEEPLLEQRRQRAVQVGRLGKLPEFLDQPRRGIGGTEEIGEDAEAILDFAPEAKRARLLLG
jgi:hypothetical protein